MEHVKQFDRSDAIFAMSLAVERAVETLEDQFIVQSRKGDYLFGPLSREEWKHSEYSNFALYFGTLGTVDIVGLRKELLS